MTTPRLPSKEAREMHQLVISLGYWLDRMDGGHLVYLHRTQDPLTLPCTPSDHRARANDLARIKRRHPNAPVFVKRKSRRSSTVAKRRRKRSRKPRPAAVALTFTPPSASPTLTGPFACVRCDRPWESDLDPTTRGCPECGGAIARRAA